MTIQAKTSSLSANPAYKLEENNNNYILKLSGEWLSKNNNIPEIPTNFLSKVSQQHVITFDTEHLQSWDSGFITFLWDVKRQAAELNVSLDEQTIPQSAQQLLSLLPEKITTATQAKHQKINPLYKLGGWTVNSITNLGITSQMLVDSLRGIIRYFGGRSFMRGVDLLRDVKAAGPSAFIIISIVNLLVGAIIGFVGAVQLKKFSADIYVANLVGIATVRELAAVMTAIVISGRTGGAYAARIATMQGNEEIDALKVMGIPITEYLILPSMLSLMITMPILYIYACFTGVFGGLLVSILMLKVSVIGFLQQTIGAVAFDQFIFGIVKTIAFAMFIGVSSCHIGMKAGRSAADVGIAATQAVVTGIVGVIAIDAIFAVIADMIGI